MTVSSFAAWRAKWVLPYMAALAIVIPILIFFAALPASAPRWLRHLHPDDTWRTVLWIAAAVLAVNLAVLCLLRVAHDDRDFAVGTLTVAFTWMAILAFVSVFLRGDNASHGPVTFVILLVLTGIALGLIAHDWSRRQLIVAAVVAVLALGAFVVRVGFDDLHGPSHDQRQAIADAATTTEKQLKQEETENLKAVPGQVENARANLAATLTKYRSVIGQPLTDAASVVLSQGSSGDISTSARDAFDIEAVKAPVNQAVAVKVVADAVHAFEAAKAVPVKQVSSSDLDAAIAAVKATPKDGADWLQRERALDIALASYKAQVTGSDSDKKALDSLEAKPVQTVTSVSVLDALTHGPEALWRITVQSPDPLLPGPLVWAIVGLLALAAWGWLLAVNAVQMPGPVSVAGDNLGTASDADSKDAKGTTGGSQIDLQTVLRIAVLQNISEPGASPGAASTNPVTDLLGIVGSLKGFASVVGVVLAITGRRYGYQVDVDLSKDSNDSPSCTALMRVKTLGGGRTLASHVISEATEVEAVRAGGLWAAGYVLNRSTRIPSWAAWNAETAQALAQSKLEHPSGTQLEAAVREAPNSGVMLVMLGHSLEQAGKRREAIAHYARAVAAHPRYPVARYRLAVGLSMMRHDNTWATLLPAARDDMIRPIRSAAAALRVNVKTKIENVSNAGPAGTVTPDAAFKALAKEFLQELRDDSTKRRRLVAALRRPDRDLIFRGLAPRLPDRVRFFDLVDSARLSLGSTDDLTKVTEKADQPGSWWQVGYNAACGIASTDPNEALRLLEQTLVHPGIHQLEASWVEKDPDLAPLRGSPRFASFVSQLSRGT